jgi:zeaxanthin glucosyltransferase
VSRFLLVTLPLPGHVNPAVAVATALRERGHDVAWAGPESYLRPLIGPDATVYPTGLRPYRGQRDRGAKSVTSVWDSFVVPYARFILPAVERAVTAYRPDAMVVDQHAIAGALVAHRHDLPWATLAPGAMELTRPFAGRPKVDAWIQGHLAALWSTAGLPGGPSFDLRFSPYLVLALTTRALTGNEQFPEHFALVGPVLTSRAGDRELPSPEFVADRRAVLITVGTLAQDLSRDFHSRAVASLAPLGDQLQAIVVAPPESVPDPPAHVQVVPRVPMLELMPYLDAVVCHGGQNTVCEALAHGVPLVVAPIKDDQPILAAQVARAAAGIRVRFPRVRPEQLREAILSVLDEPSYQHAAQRVGASFAEAGGAATAAARLTTLARSPAEGLEVPFS